jgi:hypothetical protein
MSVHGFQNIFMYSQCMKEYMDAFHMSLGEIKRCRGMKKTPLMRNNRYANAANLYMHKLPEAVSVPIMLSYTSTTGGAHWQQPSSGTTQSKIQRSNRIEVRRFPEEQEVSLHGTEVNEPKDGAVEPSIRY